MGVTILEMLPSPMEEATALWHSTQLEEEDVDDLVNFFLS